MEKIIKLINKGILSLEQNGLWYIERKILSVLFGIADPTDDPLWEFHRKEHLRFLEKMGSLKSILKQPKEYINRRKIKEIKYKSACEEKYDYNDAISIFVLLNNPKAGYLSTMIKSVEKQTFNNWKLYLLDPGSKLNLPCTRIITIYNEKDSRIKLVQNKTGLEADTFVGNSILETCEKYTCFLGQHDILDEFALYENMKALCCNNADFIYSDEISFYKRKTNIVNTYFKPNFSPDYLLSTNYIRHLICFNSSMLNQIEAIKIKPDEIESFDLVLRLTEKAKKIIHIPIVLYYCRTQSKMDGYENKCNPVQNQKNIEAIQSYLERNGKKAVVASAGKPYTYHISYEIAGKPLVSIIIPNYEHKETLENCINSIIEKTTYDNYEIIIVENNSTSKSLFEYYNDIQMKNDNIHVVTWKGREFNYSAINNYGTTYAKGDYYLLLNNDTQVISPEWIQEMIMYGQRNEVGAVGAMLYYSSNTIQHAGIIIGVEGTAGNAHVNLIRGCRGYANRACTVQNLSCVTAACCLIHKHVFEEIGGFDESLPVSYNDVDLCLRIRELNYQIIWTPFAELFHFESESRGLDTNTENIERFKKDAERLISRWGMVIQNGDPYYNRNLSLKDNTFTNEKEVMFRLYDNTRV